MSISKEYETNNLQDDRYHGNRHGHEPYQPPIRPPLSSAGQPHNRLPTHKPPSFSSNQPNHFEAIDRFPTSRIRDQPYNSFNRPNRDYLPNGLHPQLHPPRPLPDHILPNRPTHQSARYPITFPHKLAQPADGVLFPSDYAARYNEPRYSRPLPDGRPSEYTENEPNDLAPRQLIINLKNRMGPERRLLPPFNRIMLSLIAPRMLRFQMDMMVQAIVSEIVRKVVFPLIGVIAGGRGQGQASPDTSQGNEIEDSEPENAAKEDDAEPIKFTHQQPAATWPATGTGTGTGYGQAVGPPTSFVIPSGVHGAPIVTAVQNPASPGQLQYIITSHPAANANSQQQAQQQRQFLVQLNAPQAANSAGVQQPFTSANPQMTATLMPVPLSMPLPMANGQHQQQLMQPVMQMMPQPLMQQQQPSQLGAHVTGMQLGQNMLINAQPQFVSYPVAGATTGQQPHTLQMMPMSHNQVAVAQVDGHQQATASNAFIRQAITLPQLTNAEPRSGNNFSPSLYFATTATAATTASKAQQLKVSSPGSPNVKTILLNKHESLDQVRHDLSGNDVRATEVEAEVEAAEDQERNDDEDYDRGLNVNAFNSNKQMQYIDTELPNYGNHEHIQYSTSTNVHSMPASDGEGLMERAHNDGGGKSTADSQLVPSNQEEKERATRWNTVLHNLDTVLTSGLPTDQKKSTVSAASTERKAKRKKKKKKKKQTSEKKVIQ